MTKCYFRRIVVALMLVVAMPETDFVGIVVGQTKTSPSKKAKTSSTKNASNKNKAPQTQKKSSSKGKKQNSVTPKSSAEAKRMQEAAQRDIQQTKEKIKLNEQEIKTGLSDLNRLSSEIAAGRVQVEGLQSKVASLGKEISSLSEEITKNEAELKLMRDEYLKAVKKMRLTKKNQSTLAFIFASENFNQAMRRIRYMRQFSAWKERKSADIDKKIKQLENERTRLADVKEAQTVALGQLNKSQAQLEENHHKQESLVAKLRQNGEALQAHLVAKQKEANKLKETISALIAQEQAKAEAERKAREKAEAERIAKEKAEAERKAKEKAEAERIAKEKAEAEQKTAEKVEKDQDKAGKDRKKNSEKSSRPKGDRKIQKEDNVKAPENSVKASPSGSVKSEEKAVVSVPSNVNFAGLKGSLPRPVEGLWRITNPFGRHSMPELPEIEYDNPGIDAEVATGAAVKSVCGGKVSGVYKVAGYGTVVIVNHGDYYTVYGNLASTDVAVGTAVRTGQKLGTAGYDPDDSRRGSIHFEVWKGREKQNPSSWLR
ncbi:MAG: peptidoglycan DD-metalloendopeptidase family protein [Muribaculaceae bacterium]|nr:peptidoglycan DD-metalloendopeptidase family protein [Muribaculaceae bacterium]